MTRHRIKQRTILVVAVLVAFLLPMARSARSSNPNLEPNQGQWEVYTSPNYLTDSCLLGLDMMSTTEGWAVGCNGTIVHYEDSSWSVVTSPVTTTLNAVSMVSSTEGWAVGDQGVILHYDGISWSQATSPTDWRLTSLSMVSNTDGWAVGYKIRAAGEDDESIFLHYDGTSWLTFKVEVGDTLKSVQMLSETDGWAVGGYFRHTRPHWIFHYDGNNWSLAGGISEGNHSIESAHFSSSTNGWAVGDWVDGSRWIHWDGSNWSYVEGPEAMGLRAVWMVSENDGWATGRHGLLVHYDGNEWIIEDRHPGGHNLYALDMLSTNDGWAVGAYGTIMHYDGTSWSVVHESIPTAETFKGVDMVSVTEAWAVGSVYSLWTSREGHYLLFQYDGTVWRGWGYIPGMKVLEDIDMVSENDGWAVGKYGCIAHYDGLAWSVVSSPTSEYLKGVQMLNSTSGYAVGDDGTILQFGSSGEWQTMSSPTDYDLTSLHMNAPDDGWIVGRSGSSSSQKGIILHYDGSSWRIHTGLPGGGLPAHWLWSVSCTGTDDCWAVGEGGLIIHYNGTEWSEAFSPTSADLLEVTMIAPDGGWAVGRSGTILHYDGQFWSSVPSSVGTDLYGISALPFGNSFAGWAVGSDGVLVRSGVPVSEHMVYLPLIMRGY